jgi:hypothetical protein
MSEQSTRREIEDQLCKELDEAEGEAKFWNHKVAELRDAVYGISHPDSFEEKSSEWFIKDAARRVEEKKQS